MIFIVGVSAPVGWLQALRLHKQQTTEGLSIVYIALGYVSSVAWFMYGITAHMPLQLVANGFGASAALVTLVLMTRLVRRNRRHLIAVVFATGVLLLAMVAMGSPALGAIGTVTALISRLPQVMRSWREPRGLGVSIPSFGCAALGATGWLIYGFAHNDAFVVVSSFIAVAAAVWVVYRTVAVREPNGLELAELAA